MNTPVLRSMEKTVQKLIRASLPKAMSYTAYRTLVTQLAKNGMSTGPEQTEALADYTRLNDRRMKRWDKTLKFSEEALAQIAKADKKIIWLVLVESWCGDVAPSLPVMNKIAELNPAISLRILLRDENESLMNCFLTNGGKSIPKLIAIDEQTKKVIGEWGARSKNATELVEANRKEHGEITPEFKQELQLWYNKDKGQSILGDLLADLLLKQISDRSLLRGFT